MVTDTRREKQRLAKRKHYATHIEAERERARRWRAANRERIRQYEKSRRERDPTQARAAAKRWYEKTKAARRAVLRSRWHGLTGEQVAARLAAQGGVCAICRNTARRWAGDHDHYTGRFRAVLCSPCNVGIGHLKDNPARLRAAADYLERHAQLHALL